MELSPKAMRYVLESLEHYRNYHDRRLEQKNLDDDEISDLTNDREFLTAIIQDLQKNQECRAKQADGVRN